MEEKNSNKLKNDLKKNIYSIKNRTNNINLTSLTIFSNNIFNQILYELPIVYKSLLLRSSSGAPGNGNGPPNRPYTTTNNNNENKKKRIIEEIANYILARIIIITQLYTLNYDIKQILLLFIQDLINQRIHQLRRVG